MRKLLSEREKNASVENGVGAKTKEDPTKMHRKTKA
jgi:hypothetical protein